MSFLARWGVRTFVALAAWGFSAPGARGCTCADIPDPRIAMARADAVFTGTVTARHDPFEGQRFISTGDPIEYVFSVERVFKGPVRAERRVVSERGGASCGFVFEPGESYLVYASAEPDVVSVPGSPGRVTPGVLSREDADRGLLRAGLCTRTAPLREAAGDLEALPPAIHPVEPAGKPELAAVLQGLRAEDSATRLRSLNLLAERAGEAGEALFPALEPFAEADEAEALTAMNIVEASGDATKAVPWLERALAHPAAGVRRAAAAGLGRFETEAGGALPGLVARLRGDPDYGVRAGCAEALGRFGPAAAPAVSDLIAALDDSADPVRSRAVVALAAIGPAAREALPELLELAGDEERWTDPAPALASIGFDAVPALVRALDDPAERTRVVAARSLALMTAPRDEAVPALIESLTDDSEAVRFHAAWALACTGEGRETGMSWLLAKLSHGGEHEQGEAAHFLCLLGPRAESAAPVLTDLAEGGNPHASRVIRCNR